MFRSTKHDFFWWCNIDCWEKSLWSINFTLETYVDHQLNVRWSHWNLHVPTRHCWCLSQPTWPSSTPLWTFSFGQTIDSSSKKKRFCHLVKLTLSRMINSWLAGICRQNNHPKMNEVDEDNVWPPSRSNWKRLI